VKKLAKPKAPAERDRLAEELKLGRAFMKEYEQTFRTLGKT
jgi:hypothetical protein